LQQTAADRAFEHADLPRDGLGGEAARFGGALDAAGAPDEPEVVQLFEVDHSNSPKRSAMFF